MWIIYSNIVKQKPLCCNCLQHVYSLCIIKKRFLANYVSNLSAKKEKKEANARVFKTDEDVRRKKCYSKAAQKRQEADCCLMSIPKKDVSLIFRRGKLYKMPKFQLRVYEKKAKPFRCLIICSKKVDKRATRRNLIRRRIREILRKDVAEGFPKHDVIVEVRAEARDASFRDLREELSHVFHF